MRIHVFLSFSILFQIQVFGQQANLPCGEVFYESFEYNMDQWSHIGKECKKTNDFSSSGTYAISLRDNSGINSSISTQPLILGAYTHLNLNFHFFCKGFEDQEYFALEVSTDGGEHFKLQQIWVKGIDFENERHINESVSMELAFSDATVVRFKSDASHNNDIIIIDEIQITDCPKNNKVSFSSINDKTIIDLISIKESKTEKVLSLETNPSEQIFTLNLELLEGQSGSIEIYNTTGAKLSRSIFKYDHNGQLSLPIDYLTEGNYSVCVKSSDDKLYVLRLTVGS